MLNPPATDRYAALKDRLVSSFADSAEKKPRKLLNEVDLGDRRNCSGRMRNFAQNGVLEEVFKFLSVAPTTTSVSCNNSYQARTKSYRN